MTCRTVRARLHAYLQGELDADERQAVLAHLGGCPRCARALRQQRAALAALRRLPASAPSARVTAALAAPPPDRPSRRAVLARSAAGVALAGAGTLAVVAVARAGREARRDAALPVPVPSAGAACRAPLPSAAGAATAAPPPNGHALVAAVPPGFAKAAENATLALYVAASSGQIAVQDKRHGLVWLSNPWRAGQQTIETGEPPAYGVPGGVHEPPLAETVLFLDYVTADDPATIEIFPSGWEQAPRRVSRLPDGGARVAFTFRRARVSLAMDYRLGPDYLDVTIPQDQLGPWSDPTRQPPLYAPPTPTYYVSIAPLPFFGAASDDARGILLLPDGCTAPLPYALPPGATPSPAIGRPAAPVQGATPAFGLAEELPSGGGTLKGAFVALVTQGADTAAVQAEPAAGDVRYSRVGATFQYRRPAGRQTSADTASARAAPPLIAGDRTIRYILLGPAEATADGMRAALGRAAGQR